jgi:hypothetical protein
MVDVCDKGAHTQTKTEVTCAVQEEEEQLYQLPQMDGPKRD